MRIGITFDLKDEGLAAPGQPDDLQEEFDSPKTVEAIAAAIRQLGHDVTLLGDGAPMLRKLLDNPPDFVFNFAEGTGIGRSREARVPGVLEMLGIPYTGSDPLTMAVTLDKNVAKTLVRATWVEVPWGFVIYPDVVREMGGIDKVIRNDSNLETGLSKLPPDHWPVIVKPAWEGSSKGIRQKCLVEEPGQLRGVVERMLNDYQQPILIEEYIQGDEITVGILGNAPPQILGVMRVVPKTPTDRFVYGLEIKRDYKKLVEYECPPRLPQPVIAEIERTALRCYQVLGCRDVSRVDFRLKDGVPYFLEVNPLPGLNPDDSDLVIMSRLVGWSYERLVGTILQAALERQKK